MRLLATHGDEPSLESVNEEDVSYAILSHRWLADEEEVTYNDLKNGRGRGKKGWIKLMASRRQALLDGYDYIWMDTCCIDKSSSQELTESINAMFRWYRGAGICYVYLHDMPDHAPFAHLYDAANDDVITRAPTQLTNFNAKRQQEAALDDGARNFDIEKAWSSSSKNKMSRMGGTGRPLSTLPAHWSSEAFYACEWFKRGWTLQEMLAPSKVFFFTQSWTQLSSLRNLVDDVAAITNVHREVLTGERPIKSYSIAQRMSWAAGREVKRIEDQAYSLLGIMDVSITVVYGEGKHAFQRLQDELLRSSSDDTIFVFDESDNKRLVKITDELEAAPLLAESPDAFRESRDIVRLAERETAQTQILIKEVSFDTFVIDNAFGKRKLRNLLKRHPRDNFGIIHRQALLSCSSASDMSRMIALNVCSLPKSVDRFFISSGERSSKIDPFKAHNTMFRSKVHKRSFNIIRDGGQFAAPEAVLYTTLVFSSMDENTSVRPTYLAESDVWSERTWTYGMYRRDKQAQKEKVEISFDISIGDTPSVEIAISLAPAISVGRTIKMRFKDCRSLMPLQFSADLTPEQSRIARFIKRRSHRLWTRWRIFSITASNPDPALGYRDAIALRLSSHHLVPGICILLIAWLQMVATAIVSLPLSILLPASKFYVAFPFAVLGAILGFFGFLIWGAIYAAEWHHGN